MLDYDLLVQAISDWKAGARPGSSGVYPASAAEPEPVEEIESGLVEMADVAQDEADASAEAYEEAPVEEAYEDAPVEEAYEDAPVEEAYEDAPAEEASEEAPAEEAYEEAPVDVDDEVPVETED